MKENPGQFNLVHQPRIILNNSVNHGTCGPCSLATAPGGITTRGLFARSLPAQVFETHCSIFGTIDITHTLLQSLSSATGLNINSIVNVKTENFTTSQEASFSAWNPGIVSNIPQEYQPLETIYQQDNVFTSQHEVEELCRETGLSQEELVQFRPARLVLHELIVRVSANIVVREGEHEEDLGIHFREIAQNIYDHYIQPELAGIEENFYILEKRLSTLVNSELENLLFAPASTPQKTPWYSLFKPFKPEPKKSQETTAEKEFRLIASFREKGLKHDDPEEAAVYRSLYRVLGSISSTRGYLGQDRKLLARITIRHACNYYATRMIGDKVEGIVSAAIAAENYTRIPDAEKPILISLKGTSASGKSSLRPMLQDMIRQFGIEEDGYGTISPDIWRRLLLDYNSLGQASKYAGRLTSYEVNIIDSKLDHYIRTKAETSHSIPHMVVDRFRFDSFSSEKISRILHNTYVRYIDTMYMFFVITPPEETVVRGWERGQTRGRYKAVEDFLGHSVEAYTGIPKLLFKWLAHTKPQFVFEFLDNSVPKGAYPTTIARGTQSKIEIFDPVAFIDIQRYQHINVMADNPASVYLDRKALKVENNIEFLQQCIAKIERVDFIEADSNQVYLQSQHRKLELCNESVFRSVTANPEVASIFAIIAPDICR